MRRPKIVSVVGARPQFIKASPVSRQLRKVSEELLVHTGQHYDVDMSDVFFDELGIPAPDFTLGVSSKGHARQTGEMMEKLEEILLAEKPDFVLVYGDTNSTLAGALTASKLNLPVAHVEAGLRSFDMKMPEEVNRVIADRLSRILFVPTETAVRNLAHEGISEGVHLVGDVMVDALKEHIDVAASRSRVLQDLGLEPGEYIVATVHRAANTDVFENLSRIVEILMAAPRKVVFPVHPRTREALRRADLEKKLAESRNVLSVSPLGYLDMLFLQKNADAVLTDSGGMQKEAYLLGVRCITLREETEWVETVEDGWNKLVGSDVGDALEALRGFMPASRRSDRFGKGDASVKIASILGRHFETTSR
ncbi:MAG: UDP-N-acetylglucosamine 2-epimerase (non-hydrolyzing) [Candidatus Eisenbacteria bacterium]|nr:UDP-N-acetylglucosamine 2-epimerase (non-hydrolyzing) [Candidatus Eisenbacteria bacterium]